MTAQATSTRSTITRAALTAAVIGQAGVLVWIALMPTFAGQPGVLIGCALLSVVAAGLLFVRQGLGAVLAVVAAIIGGLLGFFLSICFMCGTQTPISGEALALDITSVLVLVLALFELRALRMGWVIIPIAVVFLTLANNPLAATLVVAAALIWFLARRRRSGRAATPNQT